MVKNCWTAAEGLSWWVPFCCYCDSSLQVNLLHIYLSIPLRNETAFSLVSLWKSAWISDKTRRGSCKQAQVPECQHVASYTSTGKKGYFQGFKHGNLSLFLFFKQSRVLRRTHKSSAQILSGAEGNSFTSEIFGRDVMENFVVSFL